MMRKCEECHGEFEPQYKDQIFCSDKCSSGDTNSGRTFDEGRREQGFKSQEHLDAFYRYYDHTKSCAECQKPGTGMVLEDNSIQPTQRRCATAQGLYAEWHAERFVTEAQSGAIQLGALFTALVLIVFSLTIGYVCGRKAVCEAPASSVTKPK